MISLKLTLVLIALNAGLGTAFCPSGWSQFRAYCIKYVGYETYEKAITICKGVGGRLVEPQSKSSLITLQSLYRSVWIGVFNNRFNSTGELVDFTDGTANGAAFINYKGIARSTSPGDKMYSYCELPAVNSACLSVGKLLVEESFTTTSSSTCMDACKRTKGCKFWTYSPQSCGLRFYSPGYLVGGGIPSQTRTGFPNYEIKQSGRVLVGNAVQNVESAADCQKLCYEDPKCNSFIWTLYDYTFGGINNQLCVFIYGKATKSVDLVTSTSFAYKYAQTGSGPRCCNGESSCQIETFQSNAGGPGNKRRKRSMEDMPSDEELQKYQEEFEEFLRTGTWPNSTITETTTTVGQ